MLIRLTSFLLLRDLCAVRHSVIPRLSRRRCLAPSHSRSSLPPHFIALTAGNLRHTQAASADQHSLRTRKKRKDHINITQSGGCCYDGEMIIWPEKEVVFHFPFDSNLSHGFELFLSLALRVDIKRMSVCAESFSFNFFYNIYILMAKRGFLCITFNKYRY